MKDMTKGNILKHILTFAVFIFIGGMMQNLYLIVDSIIIGRYIGEQGLAAIGIVHPLNFVVIGFLIGITQGFSMLMAKSFGENNIKKFKNYFYNSIILCFLIGFIIIIILSLTNGIILKYMNTPTNLYEASHNFLLVLYLGTISNLLYNLFAGVLRSIGNSFAPLIFLTVAVIFNIFFAYLFVAIFGFGIIGSAWATILSQTISAISCFLFIKVKYPQIIFDKSNKISNKNLMKKLLHQGIPLGLQFSFTGLGVMVVQSFLNEFSVNYIAGFSVANRIQNIIVYVFVALGIAMSTFTSQNYGAKKLYRIKKAIKITTVISIIASLSLAFFVFNFGDYFTTWFINNNNTELIEASKIYFHSVFWGYPLLAILIIYRHTLQGYGFSIIAMLAGVIELIMRVFIVMIFTKNYGYLAICFADSITWAITAFALIIFYVYLSKIKEKQINC